MYRFSVYEVKAKKIKERSRPVLYLEKLEEEAITKELFNSIKNTKSQPPEAELKVLLPEEEQRAAALYQLSATGRIFLIPPFKVGRDASKCYDVYQFFCGKLGYVPCPREFLVKQPGVINTRMLTISEDDSG